MRWGGSWTRPLTAAGAAPSPAVPPPRSLSCLGCAGDPRQILVADLSSVLSVVRFLRGMKDAVDDSVSC